MAVFSEEKLKKNFYLRDVTDVAKELLGKFIVHSNQKKKLIAKIVEVEAYQGSIDKASHSFKGKTLRNKMMFEEGGRLYVYLIYGLHYCANIVTGEKGIGDAILIRAVEPLHGINFMKTNRSGVKLNQLTNGPAKFCSAFGINKSHDGIDLSGDTIYLTYGEVVKKDQIVETTRVGITKSTELKWRYFISDNKFVSKK